MNLTSSHYKYLLAIYQISKKHPQVSSADVARKLNVSKPSVSTMLTSLVNKGLVAKERYGKVNLTEEGRQIAAKLRLFNGTDNLAHWMVSSFPHRRSYSGPEPLNGLPGDQTEDRPLSQRTVYHSRTALTSPFF